MLGHVFEVDESDVAEDALKSLARSHLVPELLEAELVLENLGINPEGVAVLVPVIGQQLRVDLDGLADPIVDLAFELDGDDVLFV